MKKSKILLIFLFFIVGIVIVIVINFNKAEKKSASNSLTNDELLILSEDFLNNGSEKFDQLIEGQQDEIFDYILRNNILSSNPSFNGFLNILDAQGINSAKDFHAWMEKIENQEEIEYRQWLETNPAVVLAQKEYQVNIDDVTAVQRVENITYEDETYDEIWDVIITNNNTYYYNVNESQIFDISPEHLGWSE